MTILEEEELNIHDSDLITLISELEREKCTGTLEKCLNLVARKVAEILLRQEAMLLPDVRDMLVNHFQSENHPTTDQVTSKFLFSYLKQRLGKHLACCTRVRSIGTLLYRKGGDLLTTITNLLYRQRKKAKDEVMEQKALFVDKQDSIDQLLTRLCSHMNSKLHKQAKELIAKSRSGMIDLTQIEIDAFIAQIDPSIWNMLLLLTRSARDASQSLETLAISNSKKLHCFYTLCVLLFTTNTQCNTPIHIVLTDVLDSHIGNSEKIRIFIEAYSILNVTYYQANCLPEMKKNTTYSIRIVLNNRTADVEYACCGCAAGRGPTGSCKHIAAMPWKTLPNYKNMYLVLPGYRRGTSQGNVSLMQQMWVI